MILYKYVPFDGGLRILQSQAIGFRQASYFNDPFEVTAAYPNPSAGDAVADVFDEMRFAAKEKMLVDGHAILSLTRSPDNPLMWAHYGDAHRGWVIGFDVDDEIFTDHARNTIPVQFGNVIYTKVKPINAFMDLARGATPFRPAGQTSFLPDHFEKLQRAFLYKAADWAYEEEVRIVKCCKDVDSSHVPTDATGSFRKIDVGGPLFLLELPENSIRSVCAGLRNEHLANGGRERIRDLVPNVRVQRASIDTTSWSIRINDVP